MKFKKPKKEVVVAILMAVITVVSTVVLVVACDTLQAFPGYPDREVTEDVLYGFGVAFTFACFLFTGLSFSALIDSIINLRVKGDKSREKKS